MGAFARNIRPHVAAELRAADEAEARGEPGAAFAHLERVHVLGRAATVEHVRVHWRMLRWGLRYREVRERAGQVVRFVGAAAKTAFGRDGAPGREVLHRQRGLLTVRDALSDPPDITLVPGRLPPA